MFLFILWIVMNKVYFYYIYSLSPKPSRVPLIPAYNLMFPFSPYLLKLTYNYIIASFSFHPLKSPMCWFPCSLKVMVQDLVFINCCEICMCVYVCVFIPKYRNTICSVCIMLCVCTKTSKPWFPYFFKILTIFLGLFRPIW